MESPDNLSIDFDGFDEGFAEFDAGNKSVPPAKITKITTDQPGDRVSEEVITYGRAAQEALGLEADHHWSALETSGSLSILLENERLAIAQSETNDKVLAELLKCSGERNIRLAVASSDKLGKLSAEYLLKSNINAKELLAIAVNLSESLISEKLLNELWEASKDCCEYEDRAKLGGLIVSKTADSDLIDRIADYCDNSTSEHKKHSRYVASTDIQNAIVNNPHSSSYAVGIAHKHSIANAHITNGAKQHPNWQEQAA